jgi:hypothetical protein
MSGRDGHGYLLTPAQGGAGLPVDDDLVAAKAVCPTLLRSANDDLGHCVEPSPLALTEDKGQAAASVHTGSTLCSVMLIASDLVAAIIVVISTALVVVVVLGLHIWGAPGRARGEGYERVEDSVAMMKLSHRIDPLTGT